MDPFAEARRRQEEKYQQHLSAQAAKKAAQEDAEATKAAQDAHVVLRQKRLEFFKRRGKYTQFDWSATRLQQFVRKCRQSRQKVSEPIVTVCGDAYPFSVATQMYDAGEAPFDTPEAKSTYDAVLRRLQTSEFYGSPDNQLSPHDQVVFILLCLSKGMQPEPELLFGVFDADVISQLLSIDLSEYPQLSRTIRLINLILNGHVPAQIFEHLPLGTNLEEFIQIFIQDIQFELEEIGKKQDFLVETIRQPNPDDEIQCTNCQQHHLAKNMHKQPRGSFFFCTNCAPLAGIFPIGYFQDDGDWGEARFPPNPPMPI